MHQVDEQEPLFRVRPACEAVGRRRQHILDHPIDAGVKVGHLLHQVERYIAETAALRVVAISLPSLAAASLPKDAYLGGDSAEECIQKGW